MFNAVNAQVEGGVDRKRGVSMCCNFDARGMRCRYDGGELGVIKSGYGVGGKRGRDVREARARRIV